MKELEARRHAIKVKAALLEKEEEKRRFRAKALQQGMNEDDVGPQGMTRFLQQVTGSDASAQQSDAGVPQQATEPEQIFKPDAWNPSLPSTKSGEAEGSGDKFKPGTWQP